MCKKTAFEIGDTVIVKYNLKQFEDGINKNLSSNLTFTFTSAMIDYEGALGKIVKCEPTGYVVNFDEPSTILSKTLTWPPIALKQCFSINSYIKPTSGYPVMAIKNIDLTSQNRLYYETEHGYQWYEDEVELASYSEYLDYRNLLKETKPTAEKAPQSDSAKEPEYKTKNDFMELIKETLDKIDETIEVLNERYGVEEELKDTFATDASKEEVENKDDRDAEYKRWIENVRSLIEKVEFFTKENDEDNFCTSITFKDDSEPIVTSIPMDNLSLNVLASVGVLSGILVWVTGRNPYLNQLIGKLAADGIMNLFEGK